MNNRFLEINDVYETKTPNPVVSNHFLEINDVYVAPKRAPKPAPIRFLEINGLYKALSTTPGLSGADRVEQQRAVQSSLQGTLSSLSNSVGQPPVENTPAPIENRFNDVVDDETGIHGWDLSSNTEADALYGYAGTDGGGAFAVGTGLVDWQNSDQDQWLQSFEIATAEFRMNLWSTDQNFIGIDADAQVLESEFDIAGQQLNFGYATANLTIGGDQDGMGMMVGANLVDATYRNGAPSAENSNDLGVGATVSVGPNLGGVLFHANDPDQDGVLNLGAEVVVGPVGVYVSSETAGAALQSELENVNNAFYNGLLGTNLPVDDRSLFERASDKVSLAFSILGPAGNLKQDGN